MWHSHSWLCSWVVLCSGRCPRRAPFPSFPIPQKTRITQKTRTGEVKDPGLGHLRWPLLDYFRRPAAGPETSDGVERAFAVTMVSRNWLKRSAMVLGECGTSTVLVLSLAAISFSVSKYWVIKTSCITS